MVFAIGDVRSGCCRIAFLVLKMTNVHLASQVAKHRQHDVSNNPLPVRSITSYKQNFPEQILCAEVAAEYRQERLELLFVNENRR